MKKYNIPPGIALTLVFAFIASLLNASAFDPALDLDVQNRVENLNSSIAVKYNSRVKSKIAHLVSYNKHVSAKLLGRSTLYFPLIEGVLRERNLPQDLKYLAVIESGLNPNATSRVKATGMWQFMKATARYVGLDINGAVDERRDPIKSTYAALDYLEILYEQFDDWTLALAAYNCGPGNVRKAIRRSGGKKDYWAIQKYLPKETQNYIPKMIAMNYMMSYYYAHDIRPEQVDEDLKFTASVKVFDKVNLRDVAKEYNLEFDLIKKLNPAYIRNFIPKSEGKHYLTLPESHLYEYASKSNLYDHVFHVKSLAVDSGSGMMTFKEDAVVEELKARKEIQLPKPLKVLPLNGIAMRFPTRFKMVKLKRGQTIMDLARVYAVSVEDIISDNNYSFSNLPKQGDLVKIPEQ